VAAVPTVAVVGFPNVGKSTLVNRLAGGREAVVHSEAGVTRDRKRVRCEWNGREFDLLDTGGIDLEDESEMAADIQRQARLGMEEADAIVLVTDSKSGLRSGDTDMARQLRASPVPVIVAVNKSDRADDQYGAAEFHALGLGEPFPVSATHGMGTGDLLDRIVEAWVEDHLSVDEIIASGLDPQAVRQVVRLITGSEYKRRQAAPGIKLTAKAFGIGRRYPIAARF